MIVNNTSLHKQGISKLNSLNIRDEKLCFEVLYSKWKRNQSRNPISFSCPTYEICPEFLQSKKKNPAIQNAFDLFSNVKKSINP